MPHLHTCTPENAQTFHHWITAWGGVAIWPSENLSDPGRSWSTPAKDPNGNPAPKPNWAAANQPERVITDLKDVDVITYKEFRRFRVGVRMGTQGLCLKVTDGGTRRIRSALCRAGEGATYRFDYETQEAVIEVPDVIVPLDQFMQTVK